MSSATMHVLDLLGDQHISAREAIRILHRIGTDQFSPVKTLQTQTSGFTPPSLPWFGADEFHSAIILK